MESVFIPQRWDNYNRAVTGSNFRGAFKRVIGGAIAANKFFGRTMPSFRGPQRKRTRSGSFRSIKFKRARFTSRIARKSGMTAGRGVTLEHDRARIYRKRRMPRFKKRRWRRFVKKVFAVAEKNLGSRTVVFNRSIPYSSTSTTVQIVGTVGLYTMQSNTSLHQNDLDNIGRLEGLVDTTVPNLGLTGKYFFQSGVLDLSIRNVSFLTGDENNLNALATLEVDIYEMTCRMKGNETGATFESFDAYFQRADAITPQIPNPSALPAGNSLFSMALSRRGATPWDLPFALSKYGIKIWKKTKFFVRNGSTITYQMRDPKRRVISRYATDVNEGCNKPGWTKWVLILAKPVPGIVLGVTPGTGITTAKLQVGCTRKYLYKVEGINDDRDQWITQT